MINPDIERRHADCTVLVEEWGVFLDLINRAFRQPDTLTPQLENQFLANKARIAMLHDSLMTSLKNDKAVGNKLLEIVNRSITLRSVSRASDAEQKKTESEWHECFLMLNETVSTLNEERLRLADINEFSHKLGILKETILANIGRVVTSTLFKFVTTIVVLVAVVVGIQLFGIYNYDNLRDVRAIKPVVKVYLGTVRLVGLDMAYYEVADVTKALKAPEGLAVKGDAANFDKDRAAEVFSGYSLYNNAKLGEVLRSAQGYDRLTFNRAGNEVSLCQAYVFWFRKTKDAKAAAREARVNIPASVIVESRANVLVLIQSQDAELRSLVHTGSVRKL